MLFLLSPAKSLDYETPPHVAAHTLPVFADRAAELIGVLRQKSRAEVAELMDLSEALADLNVDRYAAWQRRFTARNSKQAALASMATSTQGWRPRAWARRTSNGPSSTSPS
jgi:cytoplasmic iron level regulating protein YaaA (DUF328/UPF0246 family)